jgi:hypothetical protein
VCVCVCVSGSCQVAEHCVVFLVAAGDLDKHSVGFGAWNGLLAFLIFSVEIASLNSLRINQGRGEGCNNPVSAG